MELRFSSEAIFAKLKYNEKLFDELPEISRGLHGNNQVVRLYKLENGSKKRYEYSLSSPKAANLLDAYSKREALRLTIEDLKKQLNKSIVAGYTVDISSPEVLAFGIKESLVADSNPYKKTGDYWHNGIQMRSRQEVITASVLDSLNLEYMYEPQIQIGDSVYYPDFIVFLPEFNCAFIIECFGRANDKDYMFKNAIRIANYINCGMRFNQNLLVFCGTENSMPTVTDIAVDIINLVNNIARQRVVRIRD